jgi:hypothetical protein
MIKHKFKIGDCIGTRQTSNGQLLVGEVTEIKVTQNREKTEIKYTFKTDSDQTWTSLEEVLHKIDLPKELEAK